MKITEITATNFRALQDVALRNPSDVNVIVGPNAIGKSTLLDAIRIPKSVLVPRLANEGQQALIGLGALSPHNPTIGGPGMDLDGLANVRGQPIRLATQFNLNTQELMFLKTNVIQLGLLSLQAELARPDSDTALSFTQYLSTQTGQKRVQVLSEEAKGRLDNITESSALSLALLMRGSDGTLRGEDAFSQMLLAVLDRGMPFQRTLFSYFPADRAFPQGEQPIQLGSNDAQQQVLSYMAQPSLKYNRLKQVLIQNLLLSANGREILNQEFSLIFDTLLPGKSLSGIEINEFGMVKVTVNDSAQNKTFDIDFMSSGEKGLLLTFLFLRLSMQDGGIVMIDEPELHLNSAVCDKILPFLIEHCIKPKKLQAFICTHSPEIVARAFERDDCSLYHLRSGTDLTPIMRQDLSEVFEVFARLGSSPADVLFTKGGIYVEGVDDAAILKAGFGELISGFKLTSLGGRGEVQREVPALQAQEAKGHLSRVQLFILDNDRKPTGLTSSKLVKVAQLERYCIENYLLDENILFDAVTAHANNPVGSRGQFPNDLKELAISQAWEIAARAAYGELQPEGSGIRKEDVKGADTDTLAGLLADRLHRIAEHLDGFDRTAWIADFKARVEKKTQELEAEWANGDWKKQASGKIIFEELYRRYNISMKKPEFKREVMLKMAAAQTDDWRVLRDLITSAIL